MIKHYFLLIILCNFCAINAQDFPVKGNSIDDFIPQNWQVIITEKGDLNKDNIDDAVVVIEDTNPENFIPNDGFGTDTLNINPRILLVLFKEKNGDYKLITKNKNGFIPSENEEDSPCLADPLEEGIEIEKGVLKIQLTYWLSCGSYYTSTKKYTFRYQKEHFELIGFDSGEFSRASGEETKLSVNFSTKRMSVTNGGNMFEEDDDKPKTTWSNIDIGKLYTLENIDTGKLFQVIYE